MNKLLFYLFCFTFLLSCRDKTTDFVIVNNSDYDIIPVHNGVSLYVDSIYDYHPEIQSKSEYKRLINVGCIQSHSSKSIDRWNDMMYDYFKDDTLYIGIFSRLDFDTLSLSDFKKKYPIKHEFKVTLQDMIDMEWTLVYPPE